MSIHSTAEDLLFDAVEIVFQAFPLTSESNASDRQALLETITNLHERDWK